MAAATPRRARRTPHQPTIWQRLTRPRAVDQPTPVGLTVSHALLVIACIIMAAPFFFVVTASLKDSTSLFSYPPQWLPLPPYLGNYERLLLETAFPRWMFNTLFVATVVTVLKVFIDSMAGYAFAKLPFDGNRVLFVFTLAMLLVPYGAIIIPLYMMANTFHITNTYLALILPPLANPIGIFLMRQFIVGLPRDLDNAARLDGVSEFGIYRRIVLPLIKPGLVVLAVITFTEQFMSFIWPLIAVRSQELLPLTVGIAGLRGIIAINYGLWSAASVMAMVPIAIFFFLLQKQFLARSIAGALKQ
jgi:ABC-type glycerol-3-phosphate transport system permease component